jgi:hypothetical protein
MLIIDGDNIDVLRKALSILKCLPWGDRPRCDDEATDNFEALIAEYHEIRGSKMTENQRLHALLLKVYAWLVARAIHSLDCDPYCSCGLKGILNEVSAEISRKGR